MTPRSTANPDQMPLFDFTASEMVALGRQLEELERPKAAERQQEAGVTFGRGKPLVDSLGSTDSKLSEPFRTNQVVGTALGISQSTYQRCDVCHEPYPGRHEHKACWRALDRWSLRLIEIHDLNQAAQA